MFLPECSSYERLYRQFAWEIPANFNIGRAVSDDWARHHPDRVCLEHFSADGHHPSMTYGALSAQSSAFAHALAGLGIVRGDRVALLLPQSFETVIAHVAIYKMGAIALPLALLFGVEALEYRLLAAGAKAIITNDFGLARLDEIRPRLPALEHVISTGAPGDAAHSFADLVAAHPSVFEVAETGLDPALLEIEITETALMENPEAAANAKALLAGNDLFEAVSDQYAACQGADALLVATEWNQFRTPDFDRIKAALEAPVLFDGRNLYSGAGMAKKGFAYFCVGRG